MEDQGLYLTSSHATLPIRGVAFMETHKGAAATAGRRLFSQNHAGSSNTDQRIVGFNLLSFAH